MPIDCGIQCDDSHANPDDYSSNSNWWELLFGGSDGGACSTCDPTSAASMYANLVPDLGSGYCPEGPP
jgi:hypothetical protein